MAPYTADDNNQVLVHYMSQFVFSRGGAKAIVVLTSKPDLLAGQYPKETKMYVVAREVEVPLFSEIIKKLDRPNVSLIPISDLTDEFLKDKLFVCIDYVSPKKFLYLIQKEVMGLARKALLSVVAYDKNEPLLASSMLSKKSVMIGRSKRLSGSEDRDQSIVLGGKLIDIHRNRFPILPVLAIIAAYNEEDVIEATIRHLLNQGIDVHVIDNWSNDNTFKKIKELANRNTRVSFERFPDKDNHEYALGPLLKRAEEIAKERKQYKWILNNDADEIRWAPWKGVSLQEAISFVDSVGFNSIDYTVFNFVPTKEGFSSKDNLFTFFKYGYFDTHSGAFVQVKSWKNNDQVDLATSGGHHVAFPNQKIFPIKFFLGHYPVRSTKHAVDKIFKNRLGRYSESERAKGWHNHYNKVKKNSEFIKNPEKDDLLLFSFNNFYRDFLIERLSGVGLKVDKD